MKLNISPRDHCDANESRWRRDVAAQVNALSEGQISAAYTARAAVPVTGAWSAGDTVRKLDPVEDGGVGSKYIITGWVCVASGEPGTWLEMRVLTGN